jgi:hypothetical protein
LRTSREAVQDDGTAVLSSLADPWQLASDAVEAGNATVPQVAMLGVNAHVNYDLALAVDAVGVRPDRTSTYADHRRVEFPSRTPVSVGQKNQPRHLDWRGPLISSTTASARLQGTLVDLENG